MVIREMSKRVIESEDISRINHLIGIWMIDPIIYCNNLYPAPGNQLRGLLCVPGMGDNFRVKVPNAP